MVSSTTQGGVPENQPFLPTNIDPYVIFPTQTGSAQGGGLFDISSANDPNKTLDWSKSIYMALPARQPVFIILQRWVGHKHIATEYYHRLKVKENIWKQY